MTCVVYLDDMVIYSSTQEEYIDTQGSTGVVLAEWLETETFQVHLFLPGNRVPGSPYLC